MTRPPFTEGSPPRVEVPVVYILGPSIIWLLLIVNVLVIVVIDFKSSIKPRFRGLLIN